MNHPQPLVTDRRVDWRHGPQLVRPALVALSLLALAASGVAAATTAADTPPGALSAARAEARLQAQRLAEAVVNETRQCEASELADLALQNDSDNSTPTLAALAAKAVLAHQQCTDAKAALARVRASLDTARDQMRLAARLVTQCALGAGNACDAVAKNAATPTAEPVAAAPAANAVTPATEPSAEQLKELAGIAATAQTVMDDLRKKAAKVYDIGDPATAQAMAQDYEQLAKRPDGASLRSDTIGWAKAAQDNPAAIRSAVALAQRAASRLDKAFLDMKACEAQDAACKARHYAAARVDAAAFSQHKSAAEAGLQQLADAGYALAALDNLKDKTPDREQIKRQMVLRQLLDTNPDVKSFFGGDAVGLSAGSAEGNSTIRYTLQSKDFLRPYRLSLIASTPTNATGASTLVDSVDKIKNKTSLQIVGQNTNPAFVGGSLDVINDVAWGVTVARAKHSYLLPNAKGDLAANEGTFNDVSAGLRWAFLNQVGSSNSLLVLSASRQRYHKDSQDDGIRCLVDPQVAQPTLVDCTQGARGAPTLAYNTLLGVEYRAQFKKFDLGINLKRSSEKKNELEVPIYLIRNRDDAENAFPLTGGLSLSKSSGSPGLKWALFVSSPLSFGMPARP